MCESNTNPSPEEIAQAAETISRVESPIPTILFTEIARLVNTPLIELLPFQIIEEELFVRMIPRPEDDIVWQGMIHVPGSAFRAGENIRPVIERLFQGELEEVLGDEELKHLGINFHESERGSELAFSCYFIEDGEKELKIGKLYPVNNLPSKVVESQLPMIYMAADMVIQENGLEPLDSSLPRAEIFSFEEHLARLLEELS